MPKNGESYNIGNELTVQVEIEHVASARLIVGNYFFGYTDGFIEYKYNLENKSTVIFSKFSLTYDKVGDLTSGELSIIVEVTVGGTAIDAQPVSSILRIRVDNSDVAVEPVEYMTSASGLDMIRRFEMSEAVIKGWDLGEFDTQNELLGIYPHYVFKQNDIGNWISDGGITLGYGNWVSKGIYDTDDKMRMLIDTYAPGASFTPPYIPSNGVTYKVSGSKYIPIKECVELFIIILRDFEETLNSFLNTNQIILKQHQFDALISFSYQYGKNWWTHEPEKEMPKFLKRGKGMYDSEEVMNVFLMHDDRERRMKEALVFINGY